MRNHPPGQSYRAPEITQRNIRATVKWFNATKGFGFVTPEDGSPDAFLHSTVLQFCGYDSLPEGATITCDLSRGPKGPQVATIHDVDTSTATRSVRPVRTTDSLDDNYDRGGIDGDRNSEVDIKEIDGTVKWFNVSKGFGFIAPAAGGKDVFVHIRALERSGRNVIADGERVRVSVRQGRMGPEVFAIHNVGASQALPSQGQVEITAHTQAVVAAEKDYAVAPQKFTSVMYVSNGKMEEAESLFDAAVQLVICIGYCAGKQTDMIPGSWKRITSFIRSFVSSDEVKDRVGLVEDALFCAGNVEIDQNIVSMTAKLVDCLYNSKASAACLDLGSFVFIKFPSQSGDSTILFKRLSVEDRIIINEDPSIILNPGEFLMRLRDAKFVDRDRVDYLCSLANREAIDKPRGKIASERVC